MLSKDIRKKFLDFFKSKKHQVVESDSLVPKADPTLLFTSAGMNQFKEQFLGHNVKYKRAASSQKCLRTADLEKVGKTPSHHTFFEMLGNFSFGDYFKKEAIEWAWEFMTKTMGLEKKKLWASVYEEDQESYNIWKDIIKVPEERIVKLGAKDNFWPSNAPKKGPNGPCGPCSEIFYDWGKNVGCKRKGCDPSCSCGRFVEVWNLVFTQFDRKDGGKIVPLPTKSIDTGMGLERIASLMQGVKTNFETDLFTPIIEAIKNHNPFLKKKEDYCAIADHIRAATFAICDGVAPSNEERGYVIRKLIRKAYIRGKTQVPFLFNIVPKVVEIMKDAYPELLSKREGICFIVKEEEEKFRHTLSVALPILHENLEAVKDKTKTLDGNDIFKLVDTYGLPLEVIENAAKKIKVNIDIVAFEKLMEKRKALSRKKSKIEEDIFALNLFAKAPKVPRSDKIPLKAKIAFMVKGKEVVKTAGEGDIVELMTDPQGASFYTEAGGQIGDTGTIKANSGKLEILNTVKIDDKVVHVAKVVKGSVADGNPVEIALYRERKENIAKNHTATHLLHSALRKVLGEHVHQAGSLVAEDRLRFDFTHMKKLTERELEKVESIVNEEIKKATPIKKEKKSLEDAKAGGAIALFGEKYKKEVTVVSAGGVSKEVCGGTHVDNTKEIGIFKIVREGSVASGIRRIEAVTSDKACEWIKEQKKIEKDKARALTKKEREKILAKEKLKEATENIDLIIKKAKKIKNTKLITKEIKNADMEILRSLSDKIKSKEKSSIVVLGSRIDGKTNLVVAITKDLILQGLDASKWIKDMAKIVGGSGGGRPDFAQAGGKNPSKLGEVFEFAEKSATDIIGGTSK
ncbi:MAG: alanine--tRNA ligase [Candidatus Omnitrophica bacterium]|nr:alanine--tRNA ligase [Candidatus Omnitrophota bacterium]